LAPNFYQRGIHFVNVLYQGAFRTRN